MITAQVPRLAGLVRALERRARERAAALLAERRLAASASELAWRRADWLWPTFTSEQ
tara:strand:+ start:25463 stop:25633 length:171 start_codon:yes stop_codon:yes gene_type:complete